MRNKFFFAATRSFTCAAAFIFIFGTTALAQKAATWKGGTSGKFTDWNCHTNWKEGQSPNEFSQITSPLFAQHNEVVLTAPKNSSNTFSTFTPVRTMPTDIYDDNLQPDDYKIMSMEDRQLAKRIYLQKMNDLGEDFNAAAFTPVRTMPTDVYDDNLQPDDYKIMSMEDRQLAKRIYLQKMNDLGEDFNAAAFTPVRTMPTDVYDDNLQPDDYKIMSMEDRQLAKRIYLQKMNDLGEDFNAAAFTPVRTMPTDIYDDNLQPDDYKIMSMEDRQLAKRIYLQKTNDLGEDLNAAETSLDDPLPGEFQMEYMDRIGQSPVSRHMEKLSDLGEDFIVPPAAPSRTARHPLPMKPGEVQPLLLLEDCIMEFADGRWRPVVKSGSTKKRYNRIFSKTDKNRR